MSLSFLAPFSPLYGPVSDLVGDNSPKRASPDISAETRGLIKSQGDEAQRSPEDLAAQETQGVEGSRQLINPNQQLEAQKALGMNVDPALNEAINARANRAFSGEANRIHQQAGINAVKQHQQLLAQSQNNYANQYGFDLSKYQAKFDNQFAADQARNQAIGSILGTAGMAAGMAFGGPAGAAIGSKIGGGNATDASLSPEDLSERQNMRGF